jgi:hypothetical protein
MSVKSDNKIKIINAVEIDEKKLKGLLGALTQLEQDILYFVYDFNRAVSIKEIWDKLKQEKDSLHDSPHYSRRKYQNTLFNQREIFYEIAPSFRRVKQTLGSLLNLNLILFRSPDTLTDKKSAGLYYLNPELRVNLDKVKDKDKS